MRDAHIQKLRDLSIQHILRDQGADDLRAGRSLRDHIVVLSGTVCVADMMIDVDRTFCRIKIFLRSADALIVRIADDKHIKRRTLRKIRDQHIPPGDMIKCLFRLLQKHLCLCPRQCLLQIHRQCQIGSDAIAVRIEMSGDPDRLRIFYECQQIKCHTYSSSPSSSASGCSALAFSSAARTSSISLDI